MMAHVLFLLPTPLPCWHQSLDPEPLTPIVLRLIMLWADVVIPCAEGQSCASFDFSYVGPWACRAEKFETREVPTRSSRREAPGFFSPQARNSMPLASLLPHSLSSCFPSHESPTNQPFFYRSWNTVHAEKKERPGGGGVRGRGRRV